MTEQQGTPIIEQSDVAAMGRDPASNHRLDHIERRLDLTEATE